MNLNGFLALAFVFCLGFAFGAIGAVQATSSTAMMIFGIVIGLIGFIALIVMTRRGGEAKL